MNDAHHEARIRGNLTPMSEPEKTKQHDPRRCATHGLFYHATKLEVERVGPTKVRFTWACGTKRTKDYSKGPVAKRMGAEGLDFMVGYWQRGRFDTTSKGNRCPKHGSFGCLKED